MTLRTLSLAVSALLAAGLVPGCGSSTPPAPPPPVSGDSWKPGDPLTVNIGGAFTPGTVLREAYGGGTVTVDAAGQVTVSPGASGVALLEKDGSVEAPFDWHNAIVYFAVTDRFFNGDPSNDNGYGTRGPDHAQEIGTWHGGDWKGLTQKLDHIQQLGANALWITPIVEQVHGWVGAGDNGEFKHYGYAGYWALDFTRLDANLGSEADLQGLVDGAHGRGIRLLADTVINHPGYATGDDLVAYLPEVIDVTGFKNFDPKNPVASDCTSVGYYRWNCLVNYQGAGWVNWWDPHWIRAGLGPSGVFDQPGNTDQTRSVGFLPDFKTENTTLVDLPPLLKSRKTDTAATSATNFEVRDYLVKWQTDWVRKFGFDGFRCDTALNVDLDSWNSLKGSALGALAAWKQANPSKKIDDAPFWMTGEVYGHGVAKDAYYTQGSFDSLINFAFRSTLRSSLAYYTDLITAKADVERLYSGMSATLSSDPSVQALSYLSSHDTGLMFADLKYDARKYKQAAVALLLAPGAVQIFYGDESGRRLGPSATDATAGTRSDMNWDTIDAGILAHYKLLTGFRRRHPSIGSGVHALLTSPTASYAFTRKLDSGTTHDTVVVVMVPPT
jgi:alpha-amylase